MGDEQLSDLRLAAILSWYYWCPEARAASDKTEAILKERIERFRVELIKIFGNKCDIDIQINGGCIEAAIEDLRLLAFEFTTSLNRERQTMVSLLGRCPSCGVQTMSEPFVNLAGLGKQLEQFEPISRHLCRAWT